MKLIAVFLTSWIVGLAAYLGSGVLLYRQSISSGDLTFAVVWSLMAFALAFLALYLPALFVMRRWLRGVRPRWPFALLAVLLGVVPTALICFLWGGGVRSLVSAEASLFYCMFATVGVVAGYGFAFIYRHNHTT